MANGRWLVLLALGCGGPRSSVDTAQVCLSGEDTGGAPLSLVAGDAVELTATAGGGCHMADFDVSCEVVLEDPSTLVVTTETTWVRTEPLALGCELIALIARATCNSPPLPEGSYTIRYGEGSLSFEVPGEVAGCVE